MPGPVGGTFQSGGITIGNTGLGTFGGGTGGAFGDNPNLTQSNAGPNTPFLGGVANAGVGTGNLGQFGGYIPTPLPQFNNYADYLSLMPGADMMSYYANVPVGQPYNPGQPATYASQRSELMNSPWNNAYEFAQQMDPIRQSMIWDQFMPAAQHAFDVGGQQYGWADQVLAQAPRFFGMSDILQDEAGQLRNQAGEAWRAIPDEQRNAKALWEAGADPQQALYSRTVQQLQDQQRAGLEARGLDMTPYGAGVEGSTMANFNIDWQNQQLQRKLAAGHGYDEMMGLAQQERGLGGTLMGASGTLMGEAGAMRQMGVGDIQAGTNMQQGAAMMQQGAGDWMGSNIDASTASHNAIFDAYAKETELARRMQMEDQMFGQSVAQPFQQAMGNYQDIQNQFLTANQQGFNQNQTSGFEDPFAMLQLQSQIEMEREQMSVQAQMFEKQMEMQKKQQQQQMMMQGAQAGLGMLGGMGGK